MVSKRSSNAQTRTNPPQSKQRSATVTTSTEGNSSTVGHIQPASVSIIREGLDKYNLAQRAKDVLTASWREGTSKQYQTYLNRWQQYFSEKNIEVLQPGVDNGIEFLVSLYKSVRTML